MAYDVHCATARTGTQEPCAVFSYRRKLPDPGFFEV